ncbi:hypothetical protein C8A00DRAFT_32347 [Chaetomidium leptoderma]|uniref:Mid2 domain-containing protein n=1 Tax=Chaetomidium leptoderma TaxID=669021 RepID=A0AAN6VPC4_9PEZI|nr:hypothetical protein C8A00DRAFT_32347 [Chaetomidium leptoderma]
MQLSRALELLVLGLSAMSVAEATFVGVKVAGRDAKGIQQRQAGDEAKPDSTTSTSPPPETTTTSSEEPTSTPETTSTSSSAPTKPPVETTTSSEIPSSSSTKPPPSSSSTPPPSSSTKPPPSSSKSEEAPQESTIIVTTVITSTRDDGSQVTYTSETRSTTTPDLADNNSNGQASGMSTQTRNTVIGVVVGVGGAIILGGLALVAWRIWGRKKNQEENDGLMDYGSTVDKPDTSGSIGGRTPFQSTLESYHAPTQVNTAANF